MTNKCDRLSSILKLLVFLVIGLHATAVAEEKTRLDAKNEAEEQQRIGSERDVFNALALLFVDREEYFTNLVSWCEHSFPETAEPLKKRIAQWQSDNEQDAKQLFKYLHLYSKEKAEDAQRSMRRLVDFRFQPVYRLPAQSSNPKGVSLTECRDTPTDPKGLYKKELKELMELEKKQKSKHKPGTKEKNQ